MACGLCGKLGALLTLIPDPVLGGILLVSFGMVTAVGLSTLTFVDLASGRNLTILGSSFMVGLMVPRFLALHPEAIDTGRSLTLVGGLVDITRPKKKKEGTKAEKIEEKNNS